MVAYSFTGYVKLQRLGVREAVEWIPAPIKQGVGLDDLMAYPLGSVPL